MKNPFSIKFDSIIKDKCNQINKPIFVLTGIADYIDISLYEKNIADKETFNREGNAALFSPEWFTRVFMRISLSEDFYIFSHQQYSYLIEYLNPDMYKDRLVVIYDNLRSLLPITKEMYMEKNSEDGLEVRSEEMPVYHAEQFKIGDNYYYSVKAFDEEYQSIPFFTEPKELEPSPSSYSNEEVIDIASNPYSLDFFINECIRTSNFRKRMIVKLSAKNILGSSIEKRMKYVNALLSTYGGGIYTKTLENVIKEYNPSEESTSLLKKYWGETASFRNINVYENPEMGNATTPISQGLIVDTIISEYKSAKNGEIPRDIFITAPTGAGKSLIFQIPAFYAAEQGDVTIVVSPLKALMNDQVMNLKNERKYSRVEFINSDLNLMDRDRIIDRCKKGEIDVLYLSPELLLSYALSYFIGERRLGLLIIDEAHLITTWGRDFRVDYWFLGNHLNKIRKYAESSFPLVALTATAVYGGVNDMVFDSINSLNMHDPHKFIGEVRRSDIEFVIDTHDIYKSGAFEENKITETANFIKGVRELDLKTIVYVPYKRHIAKIEDKVTDLKIDGVVSYHGSMINDSQRFAYERFRSNQSKVMVATKAFGMGVDIPDIQVVYHYAPSGLLPDYIQEIGRAARKKGMKGYAALTFSPDDLRYSRQLFGMSSIKTYQLQEVLKKIMRHFVTNGKKRNMLLSSNDFGYIFETGEELDQKVSTALMMIEKDYLLKTRFNVLIARPKRVFACVYARTNEVGMQRLKEKYGDCFSVISKSERIDSYNIELNLDKIWSSHFNEYSFPQIKRDFYNKKFLVSEGINLCPLVKVTHRIDTKFNIVLDTVNEVITAVKTAFVQLKRRGGFFSEKEFKTMVESLLPPKYDIDKIVSFILSTYSGKLIGSNTLEADAFLQRRTVGFNEEYQIFSTSYESQFATMIKILTSLFDGKESQKASRYVAAGEIMLKNHIRLGSLIEILGIGSFETQGGDDPKIFVRINDPRKIRKDSESKDYSNFILENVKNRHKTSWEIFEHFFLNYISNDKRWDLIEDFFLGSSNEELIERYPGGTQNHIDILSYLKENASASEDNDAISHREDSVMDGFSPRKDGYYMPDSLLTIGNKTMKITQWVTNNPVLLHRTVVEYNMVLDKSYYKVLMSRLQNNHFAYYRDFMGLRLMIDYPGYDERVQASVPYNDDPVKFYKWWKKNQEKVTLSYKEQLILFMAVDRKNQRALNKAHKALIS
mgnify:FL=1